jgi:thiol:disulfide interchange protein
VIELSFSLLALGIGPLFYHYFGPLKRFDRISSGFILAVMSIILFTEILPSTFEQLGLWAILLTVLGFSGPSIIEKIFTHIATTTHMTSIFLGIVGLMLHASIDGAAFYQQSIHSPSTHHSLFGDQFSMAMILHRIPVGLTVWWLLVPFIGEKKVLLTLLAMAAATVAGYMLNMSLIPLQNTHFMMALQAFISGSLLHVVLFKPHDDGCMHTSLSHHEHSNSKKQNHMKKRIHSKIKNFLLFLGAFFKRYFWDFAGILMGALFMFLIH